MSVCVDVSNSRVEDVDSHLHDDVVPRPGETYVFSQSIKERHFSGI